VAQPHAVHWQAMKSLLGRGSSASIGELAEAPGVRECLQWFTQEKP
jgi:hypothetical protein